MIVGSRESELAMAQTEDFVRRLGKERPDVKCEIKGVTSAGDKDQTTSLKDMGGVGVFVRELDEILLGGKVDVTVNSLKDIPVKVTDGLTVGAVLPRAAVEDAFYPVAWDSVKDNAVVGTSSVRRAMMIKERRPDVRIKDIRGNINTRLRKAREEEYDVIVVARAAMDRLGLGKDVHPVDRSTLVPAAGQGAIAVECRADDKETLGVLKCIDHAKTRAEVTFERDILRYMNAGCSSPVGVNASLDGDRLRVIAVSYIPKTPVRIEEAVAVAEAKAKAKEFAKRLLGR